MAKQLIALGIILFVLLASILLVLFAKNGKTKRKILLETNIPNPKQSSSEKEVTTATEVKEPELRLSQKALPNKQALDDLEQLRNVGDRKFRIRSFQIQKKGLNEAECEDKSDLSPDISSSVLRVAVADGATESLFSDVWADILVKYYVEKGADLLNSPNLESLHQEFVQKTSQRILQMPETRQWFMYEKLERGTHATLAAIEFSSPDTIQILTVGDSCVFWRTGNAEKVEMFPVLSPEDFGAFPASICHISKTWQSLEQKIKKKPVSFEDTLQMVICTDALACWLATELQSENLGWERLFKISDSDSFTNFVETLRQENSIRNDDVTVVLIDALPLNV